LELTLSDISYNSWFYTKTKLTHTPNLSPRSKLHQTPWWLQSIHFASIDPCRLHHIVGFIKSLSRPWC